MGVFTYDTSDGKPDSLTTTISYNHLLCYNDNSGSITVDVSGGVNMYHYTLDIYNPSYPLNNGWQTISQSPNTGLFTIVGSVTFPILTAGIYITTVIDTNGCVITDTTILTEPDSLIISHIDTNILCYGDNTGSINIDVTGGTQPYSYQWTGAITSTDRDLNNLYAGIYYLEITDSNGCTVYDTIELTEPTDFTIVTIKSSKRTSALEILTVLLLLM